jgi:hypothetical protein
MKAIRRPTTRANRDWRGKPLYFADRDITVTLVPADLKNAKPGSTDDCVIVHACTRIFGAVAVEVGRTYSYVEFPKYAIKYRTLGIARLVTVAFDLKALRALNGSIVLGRIPPSGRKVRTAGLVSGSGGGNPPRYRVINPLLRPRVAS